MSLDKNKVVFNMSAFRKAEVKKQRDISKQNGIYVYKEALYRLDNDGFYTEQMGTKYIAKLIDMLYHERELLTKFYKRASFMGYWNLNDRENPHYFLLGADNLEVPIGIMGDMRKSIVDSRYEEDDTDFNELVYDLTDRIIMRNIVYRQGVSVDEAGSYKKLLKGQYRED